MLKQTIIIAIVTAIAIFFAHQFSVVLGALGHAQMWVAHQINQLAPHSKWMRMISTLITIVFIPIIVGLIPAFIYWIAEKKEMPRLREVVLVLWLILLLIFLLHK